MKKLNLKIKQQLKNECALECLSSVLDFFAQKTSRKKLKKEIGNLEWKWRNWDYEISLLALKRGFKSIVFNRSTHIFDPSWFKINKNQLIKKIEGQKKFLEQELALKKEKEEYYSWKNPPYDIHEVKAAIKFLRVGGQIKFEPITKTLIEKYIKKGIPIFFPHNATLLHSKMRVLNQKKNNIKGHHWGHVALIIGYRDNDFLIADPSITYTGRHKYYKNKDLVVESIVRFDQNIFLIHK